MEKFLIEVVKNTDGWVLIVIFALYVAWQIYKTINSNSGLKKSLAIIETTTNNLLSQLLNSINNLSIKIDNLSSRL